MEIISREGDAPRDPKRLGSIHVLAMIIVEGVPTHHQVPLLEINEFYRNHVLSPKPQRPNSDTITRVPNTETFAGLKQDI